MAKKNLIKEVCDAITEIKKILASPDVKNELLRKTLENRKLELLNELYEAVKKKASIRPTKPNTPNYHRKNNLNKGDRHETK